MRTLYLIGGPMGVGKTTVCQMLKRRLPRAAFLDGDWCWDMDPFVVTEETKSMVLGNIRHTLSGFLRCSAFENVIFCWVLHRQDIRDAVLAGLDTDDWRVSTSPWCARPRPSGGGWRRISAGGSGPRT